MALESATDYLRAVGMSVGNWGQLVESPRGGLAKWLNVQAPRDALELYNFAQHIVGWIPDGTWKLLQIDFSSTFDCSAASLFFGLLQGAVNKKIDRGCRTFLFDFDGNVVDAAETELLISNLIYVLLLFELHAQLASSTCGGKRYLSIQDGFAYFISGSDAKGEAQELLNRFEKNRLGSPSWVNQIASLRSYE